VILYSAWQVWRRRHTMAPYLIAAVVVFLVCGFWDIPQVRSYAAVMGGIALGDGGRAADRTLALGLSSRGCSAPGSAASSLDG
jgi:hypothetical protein